MKKVYVRTTNGETVLIDGIGEVTPAKRQIAASSRLLTKLRSCSIVEVSEEAEVKSIQKPIKLIKRK